MGHIFEIDGVAYNVFLKERGLKRSGNVLDGPSAKRTKSGAMIRDIIGTYYNYSMTLDTKELDVNSYDELYEALTAPVDSHKIKVPYGQGALIFDAYVSNVDDVLKFVRGGKNYWGDMSVSFVAMKPYRV